LTLAVVKLPLKTTIAKSELAVKQTNVKLNTREGDFNHLSRENEFLRPTVLVH